MWLRPRRRPSRLARQGAILGSGERASKRGYPHGWLRAGCFRPRRRQKALRTPWSPGPFTRAPGGSRVETRSAVVRRKTRQRSNLRSVRSRRDERGDGRERRHLSRQGDRSEWSAVKRAAHAALAPPGVAPAGGSRRDSRVLFDKLGSLALSRRISSRRSPAGGSARGTHRPGRALSLERPVKSVNAVRRATPELDSAQVSVPAVVLHGTPWIHGTLRGRGAPWACAWRRR